MLTQGSKRRVALITGSTGQDGAYLAVHGVKRRSSSFNTVRVDYLNQKPIVGSLPFLMHDSAGENTSIPNFGYNTTISCYTSRLDGTPQAARRQQPYFDRNARPHLTDACLPDSSQRVQAGGRVTEGPRR